MRVDYYNLNLAQIATYTKTWVIVGNESIDKA